MGRSISMRRYEAEQKREASITKVDVEMNKYGYQYLPCYPDVIRNDPMVRNPKTNKVMPLQLRLAKKLVKNENGNIIREVLETLEMKRGVMAQ